MNEQIAKALAAMAKLMPGGERIDESAGDFLISALSEYDSNQVLNSLHRCLKELKFFPTISEIIDRIDDGRPGTEEAWSLAPKYEESAAYLNNEIMGAWKVASDLIRDGGNMVSARMTFKEIYEKTVKENRSKGIKPNWWMSRASGRGSDVVNQSAVRDAVELGRITNAQALVLLPNFIAQENKTPQLPQNNSIQTLIGSTFNKMDAV